MLKNIEHGIYSQWMTFSLLASAAFTPHSTLHNNSQEKRQPNQERVNLSRRSSQPFPYEILQLLQLQFKKLAISNSPQIFNSIFIIYNIYYI